MVGEQVLVKENKYLADLLLNCISADNKCGCFKCPYDGKKDCCEKMLKDIATALMKGDVNAVSSEKSN